MPDESIDTIGEWSEAKLNILREYVKPYMQILNKHHPLFPVYIDAFADRGQHISRRTKEIVPGSPLHALRIIPRFKEYYFIDIDPKKVEDLKRLVRTELKGYESPLPEVHILEGDSNSILKHEVLPKITHSSYRRALCFLDPYGMHLDWEVIKMAGELKTVDIFVNFSIMDMNRNVLRRDPDKVDSKEIRRMNLFWGDESWKDIAYYRGGDLFGHPEKVSNKEIKDAYRQRLKEIAGFAYVPEPIAMKTSQNTIVYYLFFASAQSVARKIINDIFRKYRR